MRALLHLFIAGGLAASATLSAAPTIAANGVKNSASYADPGFPNGSIAQGSLFVVFGTGMGPAQIQYASSFPLPTTLSGTSASVTVGGSTVSCVIIFTLAGQIAAILPSNTPIGTGTITVTYNGSASATAPIKVVANSPGLFSVNQQGNGPAVITDANGVANSLANSFKPGQTVVFWGTGLGPISGSDAAVPPSGNLAGITVTANIAGQNAQVSYAGRSGFAGVDQINIALPTGLSGCYLPVYLTVAGANGTVTSNFETVSIAANGGACVDSNFPTGVSANGFKAGNVGLSRSSSIASFGGQSVTTSSDSGFGSFYQYDPAYLSAASGFSFSDVSNGACTFYEFNAGSAPTGILPKNLDAGPVINVNGPGGAKQMPKSQGTYSASFSTATTIPGIGSLPGQAAPYLAQGTYTLDNGSGGTDVGPFKLNLVVPASLVWNEQTTLTSITRSQPLKVTWTGGDPNSQVQVAGTSFVNNNAFAEFVCYAKDSDGTLTVPAAILSLLPPSPTGQGANSLGGLLVVTSTNSVTGTAPGVDTLVGSMSFTLPNLGVTYK